jgi:hypothetical protein
MKKLLQCTSLLVAIVALAISSGSGGDSSSLGTPGPGDTEVSTHTFSTFFVSDGFYDHSAIGTVFLADGSTTTYFTASDGMQGGVVVAHETKDGSGDFVMGDLGTDILMENAAFFELPGSAAMVYGNNLNSGGSTHYIITYDSATGTELSKEEILSFDNVVSPLQSDGADGFVMMLENNFADTTLIHFDSNGQQDWAKQYEYSLGPTAIEIDFMHPHSEGIYIVGTYSYDGTFRIIVMDIDPATGTVQPDRSVRLWSNSDSYYLDGLMRHGDDISLLVWDASTGTSNVIGNIWSAGSAWSVELSAFTTGRGGPQYYMSGIDVETNDYWYEWETFTNDYLLLCLNSGTGATEYFNEITPGGGENLVQGISHDMAMSCDNNSFLLPITMGEGVSPIFGGTTNMVLVSDDSHSIVDGINLKRRLGDYAASASSTRHYVTGSHWLDIIVGSLNNLIAIDVLSNEISVAWDASVTVDTLGNSDFYITPSGSVLAVGGAFGFLGDSAFAVIPNDGTAPTEGTCFTNEATAFSYEVPIESVVVGSSVTANNALVADVDSINLQTGVAIDAGDPSALFNFDGPSGAVLTEVCQ